MNTTPDFSTIVAGTRYDVATTAGDLIDCDGVRKASMIDHDARTIWLCHTVPDDQRAAVACAAVSQAWFDRVIYYSKLLETRWHEFADMLDNLDDIDTELVCEEAAEVFSAFGRLRQLGVRFDPTWAMRVDERRGAAVNRADAFLEDDTDSDYETAEGNGETTPLSVIQREPSRSDRQGLLAVEPNVSALRDIQSKQRPLAVHSPNESFTRLRRFDVDIEHDTFAEIWNRAGGDLHEATFTIRHTKRAAAKPRITVTTGNRETAVRLKWLVKHGPRWAATLMRRHEPRTEPPQLTGTMRSADDRPRESDDIERCELHHHALFGVAFGYPVPRFRNSRSGPPNLPDGRTLLTLKQASVRFQLTHDELIELWLAAYVDLFSADPVPDTYGYRGDDDPVSVTRWRDYAHSIRETLVGLMWIEANVWIKHRLAVMAEIETDVLITVSNLLTEELTRRAGTYRHSPHQGDCRGYWMNSSHG